MSTSVLQTPVRDRVRVSARVSQKFYDRHIVPERLRRARLGLPGGRSTAELVSVAVHRMAMSYEMEDIRRAYRRSLPYASQPQEVHLQPRIAPDLARWVDEIASAVLRFMLERNATQREVIVMALVELIRAQEGD